MPIPTADGFSYNGPKPNFDRDSFNTISDMKSYPENYQLDDGHLSYCKETKLYYKYNESISEPDPTLGKWEEFKPSSGSSVDIKVEDNTLIINTIQN